jgi:tetratricopeptide (TPR) repeat protein
VSDSIPIKSEKTGINKKNRTPQLETDAAQKAKERLLQIIEKSLLINQKKQQQCLCTEVNAILGSGPFWGTVSFSLEDIDNNSKDCILRKIALAASEKGFFESAVKVTELITQEWEKDMALRRIVENEIDIGDVSKAYDACNMLKGFDDKGKLLSRIVVLQAYSGQKNDCLKTIDEAFKYFDNLPSWNKEEFLWRISIAQTKIGELNGSFKTAQQINEVLLRNAALCNIAAQMACEGKTEESQKIFYEIFLVAKTSSESNYRRKLSHNYFSDFVNSLDLIATIQAQVGFFIDAIITAKSIIWDSNRAIYLNNVLYDGLVKDKDYFLCKICAEQRFQEEFEEVTLRPKVLFKIADGLAKLSDFNLALKIANMIEWAPVFAETLIMIGKTYGKLSQPNFAKECFDAALLVISKSSLSGLDFVLKNLAKRTPKLDSLKPH